MSVATRSRLLSLANQEFRRTAEAGRAVPVPRNFKGLRINISKFDEGWDRKRGAAVRLTGVLLQEDAGTLRDRVCSDPQTAKTYTGAVGWLQHEARYLRRMASMLDTAVGRLNVVLATCQDGSGSSTATQG